MSDVLLGGYAITDIEWAGPSSMQVTFRADEPSLADRYWQLYVNRRLAAVSKTPSERTLTALLLHARRAAPIALASVSADVRNQSFGHVLAPAPWNRYRVEWQVDDVPADVTRFDVMLGAGPGENFADGTIVASVPRIRDRSRYSYELPVFEQGTGDWSVGIVPRDATVPAGNAGSGGEILIPATLYPLDVALRSDGNRFDVSVADGVLTATFNYGVL